MTEQDKADTLRRIVDQVLITYNPDNANRPTFETIYTSVWSAAQAQQIVCDPKVVIEYWWHLACIGVIALTGHTTVGTIVHTDLAHPSIMVTERGRKLLEHGQSSPHHPERYINAIKRRVKSPDDIVLTYVDEAVRAWSLGLYRSSAVMLGCACERLILMLAQLVVTKGLTQSAELQKKLANPRSGISGIYEDVRQALTTHSVLDRDLKDRLDRKLSAVFEHARMLRNATGHPTGATVAAEDAEAGLLLFPGFYDLCDKIMQAL